MNKEKLLLIKEILIYADKEKIKLLPVDVVSKLLKESIDVLQALKNDESTHKPLYLEFVVKADIKDKELKKQLLEEIMEIGKTIPSYNVDKTKAFDQYVTSIMKFNTLGPTKKQLLSWARKTKNEETDTQRMNSIIDEFQAHEFSNQEILSLLNPVYESDNHAFSNLPYINSILSNSDTDKWIEDNGISHQNFLNYLSWAVESREVASLLDDGNFKSLVMGNEKIAQFLKKVKNQNTPIIQLETQIVSDRDFYELVCNKSINLSIFFDFLDELEKTDDLLSLQVFEQFLSRDWNAISEEITMMDKSWSIIELSKKLASRIREVPEEKQEELINLLNEDGFTQLLEKEVRLTYGLNQFVHLFDILSRYSTLRPKQTASFIHILKDSNILASISSIDELICFFNKLLWLETSLTVDLEQSITSPHLNYMFYDDKQIYQVYPYLIEKLSTPVTKLEKKQLETALSVLNHTTYGRKNAFKINQEIIDCIFETRFNWQRQNIIDVAVEDYTQNIDKNAYLSAVFYMSKMKERDKKEIPVEPAPSYKLYQKQIDEVNNLLKQLEQNNPKILQKK